MKRLRYTLVAALLSLALFAGSALAQVPNAQPPYNGYIGALITNTAQVPATLNSLQQSNIDKQGVICTFNFAAESGSPAVTLAIQGWDSANQLYYTLLTSSSFNTGTTGATLQVAVRPAIQTTSLPTATYALNYALPRFWRVQEAITGASTTTTGKVGCDYVR